MCVENNLYKGEINKKNHTKCKLKTKVGTVNRMRCWQLSMVVKYYMIFMWQIVQRPQWLQEELIPLHKYNIAAKRLLAP